jgi:glucosylceramidase
LWSCGGQARQQITFAANRELQVAGKCVTAGSAAVLETCASSAAQTWTRRANGEYVVTSNGQCLTDPGNATVNGTQLRIAACTNAAGQRWSLP